MKGIYCLIINVKKDISHKIGALGKINFPKGKYVYVGSAQNNVEKRIARHFSKPSKISKKFLGHQKLLSNFLVNKKIKWHIDYLLANPNVKIEKALYRKAGKDQECKIAYMLNESEEPIKNFGCSDCSCYSHLFKLKSLKNLNKLKLKTI